MKTLTKIFMVILIFVLFFRSATAQSASGYTQAVDLTESFTVNVPNSQGGYTAILLKKSGDGYTGPQEKYFSRFPSVSQLQSIYGLGTPNSTAVVTTQTDEQIQQARAQFAQEQQQVEPQFLSKVEIDREKINSICTNREQALDFLWGSVGWSPIKNCLYTLGGLRILQKLNDGYLIEVSPLSTGGGGGDSRLAFLYTSKDFGYQQELFSLWGYYVGSYEYQTQTGFENSVPAFRLSDRKL